MSEEIKREVNQGRILIAAMVKAVGGEIRVSDSLLMNADPTKVEVQRDDVRQVYIYRVRP